MADKKMLNKPTKKELYELAKAFFPKNIPTKYVTKGTMSYTIGIEGYEYKVTYLRNMHEDVWYISDIINSDGTPLQDTRS
jgi:hypothetical protein